MREPMTQEREAAILEHLADSKDLGALSMMAIHVMADTTSALIDYDADKNDASTEAVLRGLAFINVLSSALEMAIGDTSEYEIEALEVFGGDLNG